jgi:hypothetical protein
MNYREPPAGMAELLELCLARAAMAGIGTHLCTSSTITNISAAVCTCTSLGKLKCLLRNLVASDYQPPKMGHIHAARAAY